jgi:hypothetical protein
MATALRVRGRAVLPPLVFGVSCLLLALLTFGPSHARTVLDWVATVTLLSVCVVVGCLLSWRVPSNPVGSALGWVGAAPAVVSVVEAWGTRRARLTRGQRRG